MEKDDEFKGEENSYNIRKSVLPENHIELWKNSPADPKTPDVRWAKEGKGKKAVYHRFSSSNDGTWHYSGSTNGRTNSGSKSEIQINHVPNEIKKL